MPISAQQLNSVQVSSASFSIYETHKVSIIVIGQFKLTFMVYKNYQSFYQSNQLMLFYLLTATNFDK